MSAGGRFRVDGREVDADVFRLATIDPARSVVVDACAGSGKTTLLVARIVRALLEGVEPDQVLAVTFTRLAAHEMRERLVGELRSLALLDDASLQERLADWYGLGAARADALAARARALYETVLCHPRGPDITTFHRWFRTLALIGPLSSESGEGSQLTEEAAAMLQQAWFAWLDGLRDPRRAGIRQDFEDLVRAVGLGAARRSLESLVEQRTDWAVALEVDPDGPPDALQRAADRAAAEYVEVWRRAATAFARHADPRAPAIEGGFGLLEALAADRAIADGLDAFARLLAEGSAEARKLAERLAAFRDAAPADPAATILWLDELHEAVLTDKGEPRKWRSSKALDAALAAAPGGAAAQHERWCAFADRIAHAKALFGEWKGVSLNAKTMRCGADLLDALRRLKRVQGTIDFADLEAIAYRMLRDPETAAYLQCRLDRRYRHLLFDEFQDTSSLQWRVIADWLQSYAGAGDRPSVFVVGDPKQSIYRFRRAEARVFDAAKALLRDAFDAIEAGTDTTRRNAPRIVDELNRCLPPRMPHYREQATTVDAAPGLFWRLPLVVPPPKPDADAAAEPFDWIDSEREDEASLRHEEGRRIADAIAAARVELERQGRPIAWRDVYVLARSRTGFEAYERALRERGMPVQSDRAGGLLKTLEGDDLRALLAFVRRPSDDLALAQVLASPLVGLSTEAIGWIAARGPAPRDPDDAATSGAAAPEAGGSASAGESLEAAAADGDGPRAAQAREAGGLAPAFEAARDALEARGEAEAAIDDAAGRLAEARDEEGAWIGDDDDGRDHDGDAPAVGAAPDGPPRRWWPRLKAIAAAPDPSDPPPFDAPAIVARLAHWISEARRWPVHDFLDATLAQVDAFARYPAAVEPAQREVAHANLCAMLGLALDVDAGRFPSLARFLRRLRGFDTLEDREGPSEGRSDALDAIRMMTIHASKGLEAELVVLADAHQTARADGHARLHVDWSPEAPRPTHLSFVLDKGTVGRARQESFERDEALREKEDRNLLYVALTRARRGVIVSGTASRGASSKESWYAFLEGVPPPPGWDDAGREADAAAPAGDDAGSREFVLQLLELPRLDVGERLAPGEGERDARGEPAAMLATELGHAMHRALELLPLGHDDDAVLAALHAFALDDAHRRRALERARAVRALPALAPAFDPLAPAACEFEILDGDGEPRRVDRLARVGDALWIVDYKWSIDPGRRHECVEQLAAYRDLVARLEPAPFGARGPIVTVLVDASSGEVELDPDLAARSVVPG